MKQNSLLLGGLLLALSGTPALAQTFTFNGNGATGFGGAIGNSVLTVTSTPTNISFSLATSGFNGNGLALYIDSIAGGFNDTSTFTDTADNGRTFLSGLSTNGRTLATFAPGFGADFGISVEPGQFAGVFNLNQQGGFFPFVASAGLDATATTTLNFSVLRSDLGLSPTAGFSIEGSLLSPTAFRANETLGTSVTTPDPTNPGTAPNAGFTGSQTFATALVVPEPGTVVTFAVGAVLLGGLGLRRRSAQRA